MAKKAKVIGDNVSGLLNLIAAASAQNQDYGVTQSEGVPLLEKGWITVDTAKVVDGKAPARITDAGKAALNGSGASDANASVSASPYAVIKGAVLPPSKRGSGLRGQGAPKQYPFDTMEVGDSFFVPVSTKHPDPVKTLQSTVSSANMRFSEKTGEMKSVNRAKRGADHKAILDAAGNKIMEQVQVPVRRQTRKFSIRSVVKGETYGTYVAPDNGALIGRVE